MKKSTSWIKRGAALALGLSLLSAAQAQSWWKPPVDLSWQWQLKGTVNTSYNVAAYDIDLFDTPQSTINALHTQGRKVICYFSAGSSEDWRPDYSRFQAAGPARSGWTRVRPMCAPSC
jgi:hypothetical protein